ncbi:MAG: N-acetylglucosaminyl-diphospho-decaprenol L-rhamnosyltransferase [Arenicella sp.]|jgi:N-acetylglucosaminyl-diphospho-decaprenol L-rhamnosyltransferase
MKESKSEQGAIKLLLVSVNYFSADLIAKLVKQLENQALPAGVSLSIVCADNSVSADQEAALKRIKESSSVAFELLVWPINIGFGSAINKSIEGKEFDYVCCLNPDVSLRPNALYQLLTHCQKEATQGIWGGVTVDKIMTPDFRHAWQEPSLKNTLTWAFGLKHFTDNQLWHDNYQHIDTSSDTPYPVDSISGCCMLISAPAWHALGGFDSDFFLYSEEIDLCRRSRKLGFQPTVVPLSILHHASHSHKESIKRLPLLYASKFLYAEKHHGPLYNILYRGIISIGSLIRMINVLSKGRANSSRSWASLAWRSLVYPSKSNKI